MCIFTRRCGSPRPAIPSPGVRPARRPPPTRPTSPPRTRTRPRHGPGPRPSPPGRTGPRPGTGRSPPPGRWAPRPGAGPAGSGPRPGPVRPSAPRAAGVRSGRSTRPPQGVHVAPGTHRVPGRLLGGHVRRRPHNRDSGGERHERHGRQPAHDPEGPPSGVRDENPVRQNEIAEVK